MIAFISIAAGLFIAMLALMEYGRRLGRMQMAPTLALARSMERSSGSWV